MVALTQQRLTANAFRTLGLSAAATQAEIDGAARRMRIWSDPSHIPPTPWDLPPLGPIDRSRTEIERAAAFLNSPVDRLMDRMTWYVRPPPAFDDIQIAQPADEPSALDLHDQAVRALLQAHIYDTEVTDAERWSQVFRNFDELAATPDWVRLMADCEAQGDFEKRATSAEIQAAIAGLPEVLCGGVAAKAREALANDDFEALSCMLLLVGRKRAPGEAAAGEMIGLLDAIEDVVEVNCRHMDQALREKLRRTRIGLNLEVTKWANAYYNASVYPLLIQALLHSSETEDRANRVSGRCAEVLTLLGLGWEWSEMYVLSEQTYELAMSMTSGSTAAAALAADIERVRSLAEEERTQTARRISPPRRYAMSRNKAKGNKRAVPWVILAIVLARLVSFLVSTDSSSSRNPRQPVLIPRLPSDLLSGSYPPSGPEPPADALDSSSQTRPSVDRRLPSFSDTSREP